MPRFYFDLIEDDHLTPDEDGLDLESLEAARLEAQRGLAEMVRGAMPDGDNKMMALKIRNESGQTPLTVMITMTVISE
jgi:hypothetical protein